MGECGKEGPGQNTASDPDDEGIQRKRNHTPPESANLTVAGGMWRARLSEVSPRAGGARVLKSPSLGIRGVIQQDFYSKRKYVQETGNRSANDQNQLPSIVAW